MDVTKIAAAETSFLHLRGPDDELLYEGEGSDKQPVGITLYGPGSSQYQKAQSRRQNAAIARLRKKGKIDQTADEKLAEQADFLTACTHSFHHLEHASQPDGSGSALYHAVYADPAVGFIADQANSHIGEWANFTKSSATS